MAGAIPDKLKRVADFYDRNSHKTIEDAANDLGLSTSTIVAARKTLGITSRKNVSPDEIKVLHNEGLNYRQIAEKVGICKTAVGRILRGQYYTKNTTDMTYPEHNAVNTLLMKPWRFQ